MKEWTHYPLTPTRYAQPAVVEGGIVVQDRCALHYGRSVRGWRFVVDNRGFAEVGVTYPTKDELLNDLPRYAASWGLA